MCASINAELSILRAKCSFLNRYSVLPRYPDEIQITDDDLKICLQYAEEVKEFIRKLTQKLTIDETKND